MHGLQPIPRDPANKGVAEVLEKSFVYVHQHGGDDVTWKPSIDPDRFTRDFCVEEADEAKKASIWLTDKHWIL